MKTERIAKNAYIKGELESIDNMIDQMIISTGLLMDEETWIARPKIEEWFKEYRVDLCYLDLNWLIQIDEIQHSCPEHIEKDRLQDIELKRRGYETTRIKVYEDNFVHADAIKDLKAMLLKRIEAQSSYTPWRHEEFDIDEAHKHDNSLVFVNRLSKDVPFPLLKLPKELSERTDLKIVLLSHSPNYYKGSNLKMVDGVYSYEPLENQTHGGGYISWSGNPIQHNIMKSGDTAVNLTKGPIYIL